MLDDCMSFILDPMAGKSLVSPIPLASPTAGGGGGGQERIKRDRKG